MKQPENDSVIPRGNIVEVVQFWEGGADQIMGTAVGGGVYWIVQRKG